MKYNVTNRSRNRRVIFTSAKPSGHSLDIGASAVIEMTEAEADNAESPGVLIEPHVDGAAPPSGETSQAAGKGAKAKPGPRASKPKGRKGAKAKGGAAAQPEGGEGQQTGAGE